MNASVVLHAHLYQPPREDPWTGEVPADPTAEPFHDWNERIAHECYRPIAPLLDWLSFNVGATLFEWLDRHAPALGEAFVAADRASVERLGHGNAIAMPYHHIILPLASRRDKMVEVRWGIRDFVRRFGRAPEGMWLPETAVDLETLDVLAEAGIGFTVLGSHQLEQAPLFGRPAVVRTSRARRLAVFAYDGVLAHEVAFGALLRETSEWFFRLYPSTGRLGAETLVSLATDGETFGHHHAGGIEALTDVLERLQHVRAPVENYAAFLARNPPREFARVVERTSWSCAHGVERWRANCGCRLEDDTTQTWRRPLREAFDWLRDEIDRLLESEGQSPPQDPADAPGTLPADWHARRMYSSCGWFFDDIAGIESRLCLAHAARAVELTGPEAPRLREGLRERLAAATSNDPAAGTGADVLDAIRQAAAGRRA